MAHRKKYSEEFKREAVALTRQPGANVSHIAGTSASARTRCSAGAVR
jgi:transposase-like protein